MTQILKDIVEFDNVTCPISGGNVRVFLETADDGVQWDLNILHIYVWELSYFIVEDAHPVSNVINGEGPVDDVKLTHAKENPNWVVFS